MFACVRRSWDVLLLAPHAELRASFLRAARLAMGREADSAAARAGAPPRVPEILFSAEFFCHPDPNRSAAYPASDRAHARFPFLNSGAFVGRAGALRRAMDAGPRYSPQDDDQREDRSRGAGVPTSEPAHSRALARVRSDALPPLSTPGYWTTIYLASREDAALPRITLDHEGDVFLSMNRYRADGDLAFDPAARRYRFRGARAAPAVIHFNGEKRDVEPFFRALGGGAGADGGAGGADAAAAQASRLFWSPHELNRGGALELWLAAAALAALTHGAAAARAACERGGAGEEEGGDWEGEALGC